MQSDSPRRHPRGPAAPSRRILRAAVGLAALLAVAAAFPLLRGAVGDESPAAAAEKAAEDSGGKTASRSWPLFRGNPQATGVASTRLPAKLSLLWKFRVPEGAFETTPIIDGGVTYVGDLDGNLHALELASGTPKWRQALGLGFMAAPAIRDGRLFIGDIDGKFLCLRADTGAKVWEFAAEAEIDSSANFYEDRVLFGSQDATLYCLKRDSGELLWKHQIEDQIRCSPTIVGRRCFVAGCDSKLHIIDLDTGKPLGAGVPINSPTGVTPAAVGDYVYFGTEGGEMLSVNWREGVVAWRYVDGKRALPFRSSPVATDKRVIFGGRTKRLYSLAPDNGAPQWVFNAKGRIDSSPVLVENTVFVGATDGRIYGIDAETGRESWSYEAGGSFTGSPAVGEGRLVIANDDGVVYCFGEKS